MDQEIENFKLVSEEILYPTEPSIVSVSRFEISQMVEKSKETDRKRMRICSHRDPDDRLHEMLIVHEMGTYVRPHKHLDRSESFHIISGEVDVFIYNDDGSIRTIISMGEYGSGKMFYYRLNECLFHTMLIHSRQLVFQETTLGPFNPSNTVFAPWAPAPYDQDLCAEYIKNLQKIVKRKGI